MLVAAATAEGFDAAAVVRRRAFRDDLRREVRTRRHLVRQLQADEEGSSSGSEGGSSTPDDPAAA